MPHNDAIKGAEIPARPNQDQGNARKRALDFLGFIRPEWDFSMGYGDSK